MKRNFDNAETLIKVENLCEFFKFGKNELKAVNNVNFDIRKGEVFGLVGESGCGKTTTGRTIIKLYNATSGNVWFKGTRIVAGTRSYKDNIRAKREEANKKLAEIKAVYDKAAADLPQDDAEKSIKIEELRAKRRLESDAVSKDASAYIAEQRRQISLANDDQKNCDKKYSHKKQAEVKEKYVALLAAEKDESKKSQLEKDYKEELRLAKREKLVTQIQMIFQDPIASLDPRMTVREIIAEGLKIKGVRDQKAIDDEVYKVLELVGLVREHASRYPHEFSGGQRQRIGVARSIVLKPDMIIADEPVSALDVSIQAQVINLLNDLRESLGLTILFIAHDLSVVKYFSDRIGVMYYGNMVELAASDDLFAHPLHPYTKSLLSAIPLPDPHYEKTRKRIVYNPLAEHDYSVDKPKMREIVPGHFIYCNDAEEQKYLKELGIN